MGTSSGVEYIYGEVIEKFKFAWDGKVDVQMYNHSITIAYKGKVLVEITETNPYYYLNINIRPFKNRRYGNSGNLIKQLNILFPQLMNIYDDLSVKP